MQFTAGKGGYECSTKGDKRFSALCALMPDGRTIEMWYQCDIKGYDIGGTNWKLGKGKPPKFPFTFDQQKDLYLSLWKLWAIHNSEAIVDLLERGEANNGVLSDMFSKPNSINQADALARVINEWNLSTK